MRRRSLPALAHALALVCLFAGAVSAAPRSPRATLDKPRLPVTTFKLQNGLTVFVHEDHTVPVVAVDVWYHVGSKDEQPGKTGFAHLYEHLMFKGSGHVPDGGHFKTILEAGGTNNATTNRDRTNYFEVVPSNFLERALFLESDRMGYLLDAVTQEKLDNQRDVVRNERRQRYENAPYGMAWKSLAEAIYPPEHPYHWLTIGEHKDLEAASLEDVKQFFRDWYGPGNATLGIVGDVKLADARRLAETYFGAIPARPTPPRKPPPPVKLAETKRLHLDDKVALERLYLVWPSMPDFAPGDAELDLLAQVLSSKSGRLYKRLVYDLQVAQSVSASQQSATLAGEFHIVVTAKAGHGAAEMERIVDEELGKLLGAQPVTAAELDRARTVYESSFVYALEEVLSQAERLSAYLDRLGRADGLDADLKRYAEATPEKVMKYARAVLRPERVVLVVSPRSAGGASAATGASAAGGGARTAAPAAPGKVVK